MDSLYLFPPDDNPQKRCAGPCGQLLPATAEYFQRNKNHKDGLQYWCKECRQAKRRKPPVMSDVPEGHKRCGGPCKRILPAHSEFFHRFKQSKDGFTNQCKQCKKEYDRDYLSKPETKEHKQAMGKAYNSRPEIKERKSIQGKVYHSRPEIREARRKAYNSRPEIRETQRVYKKVYRSTPEYQKRQRERVEDWLNRPGIREHRNAYRKAYYSRPEIQERERAHKKVYNSQPEVRERRHVNMRNRRARVRSVKGSHNPHQIKEQLKRQKHKCYYCRKQLQKIKGEHIYHVDHTYPLSRVAGTDIPANSIDYLVLACPNCNLSKHDKFPWEWPEGGRLL